MEGMTLFTIPVIFITFFILINWIEYYNMKVGYSFYGSIMAVLLRMNLWSIMGKLTYYVSYGTVGLSIDETIFGTDPKNGLAW